MSKNNEEKAIIIGKAYFEDFAGFVQWCSTDEANSFFEIKNLWTDCLYKLQGEIPGVNVSNLFDKTKAFDAWGHLSLETRQRNYIAPLAKAIDYINEFSTEDVPLSFDLLYEHEKFDIVAFGSEQFLIPAGKLIKVLHKDYSNIAVSVLHDALESVSDDSKGSIIPTGSSLQNASVSSQRASIEFKKQELERIASDMDDVKNARVEGLAELQAEIDRKMAELQAQKDKLMEVLLTKQAEMEAVKKKLEQELFVLESEIYSIRCFMGEVVDFVKLKSGKDADVESPIVLFQKLRFLDEELAKIASIYSFDFGDYKLFEALLKNREDVVETFCPNEKSVTLVRVSRTNKGYSYVDLSYGPVLAEYEVYHGKKIGILIRNGENLYMGWTDDEKINIPENMFYMPGETVVSGADENDNNSKDESTPIKEAASRYFVFSILQGALNNKKLLSLPEGVKAKFSEPSEYIIYSSADAWLVDNRYGTFDEMISRVNAKISVGDDILALEYISDGNYRSGGWGGSGRFEYNRDRNFSRRTHDTYFSNGAIYKINLIENEDDYYVSLPKSNMEYIYRGGEYYKRQREARANFLVYSDEFINLTYMNSVWLKYVITTRNLGGRGRMSNFAEVARYLNKALDFVKKREKEERALIEKYYPALDEDPEWPAVLSEWKLQHGVRNITDYQAKRFAKTLG